MQPVSLAYFPTDHQSQVLVMTLCSSSPIYSSCNNITNFPSDTIHHENDIGTYLYTYISYHIYVHHQDNTILSCHLPSPAPYHTNHYLLPPTLIVYLNYSTLRAKTGKMDEPLTGELNITRD